MGSSRRASPSWGYDPPRTWEKPLLSLRPHERVALKPLTAEDPGDGQCTPSILARRAPGHAMCPIRPSSELECEDVERLATTAEAVCWPQDDRSALRTRLLVRSSYMT